MPSTILSDNGVSSGTAGIKTTGSNDGQLALQTTTSGGAATTALTIDTSQNTTLAGSLNAPNTFGFKNRIINGGMAVDQRNAGAAQTITAAAALAYTVDRWYAWTTGANGTTQQVAGTAPSQYALKFTGATSNTLCGIAQRIEQLNCYDLASTAVTISAYMTASTNTTITAILNGPSATANTFGTIASPTVTQIATTTFSVTTSRTLFTWTIPAATMSGFNKGLELIFKAASGLGNGVTWTIESVQLEAGSAATSFDIRSYGTELALCQRYYEKSYAQGTAPATSTNVGMAASYVPATGSTQLGFYIKFAVIKRTTASMTFYSGTGGAGNFSNDFAGSTNVASVLGSATGDSGTLVYNNAGSSNFVGVHWVASAEL